ncbi:alpha/beta fold hydrolase BchO [Variovorax rhizosphaerae]|uniref:Alpha/beta fold hydrolase BchO n=1 Tax=Variovorax rhizosphaerae TaxID=1836200 RepID=A0ABU8WPH3_9BURK
MSRPLRWDVEGLDWPHREASSFIAVGGLRWHVQRMGKGPVLLLVHGTGASSHTWRDLLPAFAPDFSCVAIDLPGHAFTAAPPSAMLSLQGMARLLATLLRSLHLSPAMIVGHSAGAAIAVQLCLHEGISPDALVSINGAFLPLSGVAGLVFPPAAKVMARNSLASRLFAWRASDRSVVRQLIHGTGSRLDARGEDLYARLVRNPLHVAAALGMMARWDVAPVVDSLPRLRTRLQLIAGTEDHAVPPAQSHRVHRAVPNSAVAMVAHAGHLVHEEKPDQVVALIRRFWREGPEGRIGQAGQGAIANCLASLR